VAPFPRCTRLGAAQLTLSSAAFGVLCGEVLIRRRQVLTAHASSIQ
jgi:hypothetical protein